MDANQPGCVQASLAAGPITACEKCGVKKPLSEFVKIRVHGDVRAHWFVCKCGYKKLIIAIDEACNENQAAIEACQRSIKNGILPNSQDKLNELITARKALIATAAQRELKRSGGDVNG